MTACAAALRRRGNPRLSRCKVTAMQSLWLAPALAIGLAAGCTEAPVPACISVDLDCAPQYAPNFDNIYTMTLREGCGSTQVSCHSAAGKQGGMSFEDQQHAYDALIAGRVKPADPGCSLMIVRTGSPGTSYQMPPGDPLIAPVRCALVKWIAGGALPGQTQLPFAHGAPAAPAGPAGPEMSPAASGSRP
jgi:hypothetical protein